MKRSLILLLISSVILFSCKKKNTLDGVNFNNTHWNLFYKNGPTFTFYAKTHLFLKDNLDFENYGNVDTTYGTWRTDDHLYLKFNNGAYYTSDFISSDSLNGTIFVNGIYGDWYATRR